MGWELMIFAGLGAFVLLVLVLRIFMFWLDEHLSRRRALAAYPWPIWWGR